MTRRTRRRAWRRMAAMDLAAGDRFHRFTIDGRRYQHPDGTPLEFVVREVKGSGYVEAFVANMPGHPKVLVPPEVEVEAEVVS